MTDRESSVFKNDAGESESGVPELKHNDAGLEKADVVTLPAISEEANVGLSEFEEAKEAGVHVTKAEGRR